MEANLGAGVHPPPPSQMANGFGVDHKLLLSRIYSSEIRTRPSHFLCCSVGVACFFVFCFLCSVLCVNNLFYVVVDCHQRFFFRLVLSWCWLTLLCSASWDQPNSTFLLLLQLWRYCSRLFFFFPMLWLQPSTALVVWYL